MLYTIAIQNLRLQVSVPDSTDTAALDKVVREFNDHLMTFNGGRSVELFESKEVKLLIFTAYLFHSRNAKEAGTNARDGSSSGKRE